MSDCTLYLVFKLSLYFQNNISNSFRMYHFIVPIFRNYQLVHYTPPTTTTTTTNTRPAPACLLKIYLMFSKVYTLVIELYIIVLVNISISYIGILKIQNTSDMCATQSLRSIYQEAILGLLSSSSLLYSC